MLIVFSDFECPFCGRFAREVMPRLRNELIEPGKLMVVFKHRPLRSHRLAEFAAMAAICGGEQGRFWQLHDRMFEVGAILETDSLRSMASSLGVDSESFEKCLASKPDAITTDGALADRLGVTGTPAFFLGRMEQGPAVRVTSTLRGYRPPEEFFNFLEPLRR